MPIGSVRITLLECGWVAVILPNTCSKGDLICCRCKKLQLERFIHNSERYFYVLGGVFLDSSNHEKVR